MTRIIAALILLGLVSCGSDREENPTARALGLPADVGTVCGDPALLGVRLDDIDGGSGGGCGVSDPVRLFAVSGVLLHAKPRINCQTASALNDWVQKGAKPAMRDIGERLESLRVVAGYACRNRNSRSGGRLSEHAKGNAVDIAGLTTTSGLQLTVLEHWNSRRYGRTMKRLHGDACGPFGTVLGPQSDRFHRDHFHFDTASYRTGPFCR